MKIALTMTLLLVTTAAYAAGAQIGPTTHPDCGGEMNQIYLPTAACGFNDIGVSNAGIFVQYRYWNGSACLIGQRFVGCASGP